MTEQDVFHGGSLNRSRFHRALKRAIRPKHIGMASQPFDWDKGYITPLKRIKNQGQSFSCGGQAGSRWVEIAENITEQSAKSVYSQGYYAPTGGMSVSDLEKVICELGSTDESLLLSEPATEENMKNKDWQKDSNLLLNALQKAGYTAISVDKTLDGIACAMKDYGAVIMLIEGQNGNPLHWLTNTPQPPVKSNPNPIWAHYLCSYSASKHSPKPIGFYNSWGASCGDGGIQYFGQDYIDSGHITDVFTFIKRDEASLKLNLLQRILKGLQTLINLSK